MREALQRDSRVEMMKSRHRYDRIERLRLERCVVDVGVPPLDLPVSMSFLRALEHRLIAIDGNDVRNSCIEQFASQNAVAATDI